MRVTAIMHSDDYIYQHTFDALPWLETASDDDLIELAHNDWGGCETADRIALDEEQNDKIIEYILEYCRKNQDRRNPIGFEVHLDYEEAELWVLRHRPSVAETLHLKD